MSNRILRVLVAGVCAGMSGAVFAADAASAQKMEAVTVSASRADTKLEDMPLHTTVITQEDIQKSPAQSLDQLLRQVPGMNMTGSPFYTSDPTGQQVRMRGVGNSKVLVLLDGIPIHDPFFGTVQWFKVPMSSIERVEIIRGGNSSLWGNLAVAGVINIVSKKPTDNSGALSASYGSMNTASGAVSKNFVVSDALSLRISGDIFSTDGYQTTPDAYLSAYPGKGATSAVNDNVQIAAYFSPSSTLKGYLRAGYHKQDQTMGGYTYGDNVQKSPDMAGGLTWSLEDKSQVQANLWSQYVSFDKYNGAGCYLSGGTCKTTNVGPLVQYYNSHDWITYRELGGSALYSKDFTGLMPSMQLGVDYRKISGEDSAQTYNAPTTTSLSSATLNRTNFGQGTQEFTGVFGQFKFTPTDPLAITLSARYDTWKNTEGISTMVKGSTSSGGALPDTEKSSFNPSLSVRYDLNDQVGLRAAAYKSFRAPGLNNLYRTFSSTTSITIANSTLAPETLTGAEIGMDYKAPGLELGATFFSYTIKDMIATYKVASVSVAPQAVIDICGTGTFGGSSSNCPSTVNYYTNGQEGRSNGLELAGRWELSRAVALNGSYVYTDSYYTKSTVGDPIGWQLGGVPKDVVVLGVTWTPDEKWRNYAEIRYSGAMYLDVKHTIPQSDFTVVNLSSSYRVSKDIDVYGTVVNLFNKKYSDNATTSASSSTLGMPLAVTAGLRMRF